MISDDDDDDDGDDDQYNETDHDQDSEPFTKNNKSPIDDDDDVEIIVKTEYVQNIGSSDSSAEESEADRPCKHIKTETKRQPQTTYDIKNEDKYPNPNHNHNHNHNDTQPINLRNKFRIVDSKSIKDIPIDTINQISPHKEILKMRIPKKTPSPPPPLLPPTVPRILSEKAQRRLKWMAELEQLSQEEEEEKNKFDIEGIDDGQIVNIGSSVDLSFKLKGYHIKIYFQLVVQNIIDYANGEYEYQETASTEPKILKPRKIDRDNDIKYYKLSITTMRTVLECDADRHKFGIYIFPKGED